MIILGQLLEKLLNPAGLIFLLLLAALGFRRKARLSSAFLALALAVFSVAGNSWVAHSLVRSLEWRYLPPDPVPRADVILVLSGGIAAKDYPRPTVEVGEEGDRLLYGGYLFRKGKAPLILCAGGIVPGSTRGQAYSEDMKAFLELIQIPTQAIVTEGESGNTFEHARNCEPILREKKVKRILLVTSALHIPRAVAVFRRHYPGLEVIPAPTDFHSVQPPKPIPFWKRLTQIVPTGQNLQTTRVVLHEYAGILYYKLRGWM